MLKQLEKILITSKGSKFDDELSKLRCTIAGCAAFASDDKRYKVVQDIIADVYKRGDKALAKYTAKFDGVKLTPQKFLVSRKEMSKAIEDINPKLLKSIEKAISNVRKYQSEIFIGKKNKHPQIKYIPINKVGVCVPGASAPLPSTVIMTVVPALVAGVKKENITVVSPPRYKGSIHPVILAVCHKLGIENVYRIGGVQAVAALALGTQTISKVNKIVGPGNQWVQTAKREVSGIVGIDSIAGPSEVLIIANDKANSAWVAADMLSQAEHAPGSAVVFTDSMKLAKAILCQLDMQLAKLSRVKETSRCLTDYSRIAVVKNLNEAVKYADNFAPEHLEIQCGGQSRKIADEIQNAGAIFIGCYSPVAVGDYWAGPSHTLPTGMTAKFSSALTSNDFIKSISIIEYTKEHLSQSADDIIRLAETEGLGAHANSVKIRQQSR